MTATEVEHSEGVLITLSARQAAVAWLNSFSAASNEPERPILNNLSIEVFPHGVQFIGCDGTVLFRSWVPLVADNAVWPELEDAPSRSLVVMDPDGFGKGFMTALLRVTGEEEHAFEELSIATLKHDEVATLALGAEFMSERVVLRACGQRLDLRLYESAYVDWRRVRLGVDDRERVPGLTMAPRILALTGKLRGITGIDLEFYGDKKHVAFTARGEVSMRGLLMPMRNPDKEQER